MSATPITLAEQRDLLRDCLRLWAIHGQVVVTDDGVSVVTTEGAFTLTAAEPDLRPVRWFLQTPERIAAGRPPRAIPSIVAALASLRNVLGGEGGTALRIGPGA